MQFMPQKVIKGQAVVDFLADHSVPGTSKLYDNLPDGASRMNPLGNIIAGVGVVLIAPHNYVIPHAFSLSEPCSNNVSEYNALLIGMQLVKEIGVKYLEAYRDSKLIVNQVRDEYEVRHEDLVPYHNATIIMAEKFENFYIDHVPHW